MTRKKNVPKKGRLGIKLLQDYDEWAMSNEGGFMPVEPSNLKGFLSTQLRQEIERTNDIVIIDNPDSTTSGTKMKKKKTTKRLEDSDKELNASEVLAWSQRPPKRHRISSKRSSTALYKPLSPKDQQSGEESGNEDEVNRLLHECDAVSEKLAEMKRKMEGLEWTEWACGYQSTIEKSIVTLVNKNAWQDNVWLLSPWHNCHEGCTLRRILVLPKY